MEFPIEPNFVSHLPSADLYTVYLACEEMLPMALEANARFPRVTLPFPEFTL